VQHLPGRPESVGKFVGASVNQVTPNGMAQMRQVNADLVRAAGVKRAFDFRAMSALLQHAIVGVGVASAGFQHRHFLPVHPMASDGLMTFARAAAEDAPAKRAINFSHGALGKGMGKPLMDFIRLGDQNQSARVFVQAMDKSAPFLSAPLGELLSVVMDKRVDEGSGPMTRSGMNHQAGLFVQREESVVFVDDIERNGFARRLIPSWQLRLGVDGQRVAIAQAIARFGFLGMGMEMDEALFQQRLGMVARSLQSRGQENIEALSDKRARCFFTQGKKNRGGWFHCFNNCNLDQQMATSTNGRSCDRKNGHDRLCSLRKCY
jgi:hypothetical protein